MESDGVHDLEDMDVGGKGERKREAEILEMRLRST
jgi:hypothetical protein